MKNILAAGAVVAMTATTALANASYPLAVSAGGVDYLCKNETEVIDGVLSRRCIRVEDDAAGALFSGGLSTTTGIVVGGISLLVLAAALNSDDDDSTTSTD